MYSICLKEVNSLPQEQFLWMFGNMIELCPAAAAEAAAKRPFDSTEQVCDAFRGYLDGISEDDKVTILNLHPDLAGKLSASGELTRESTDEQRSAGLDQLTAAQKSEIDELNKHYKIKFGFPFIICARENKIKSIIEGLKKRYNHTREQEISIAIEEVKKICTLRILDIIHE